MKIAVQIFGHLRSYRQCFKALHKCLLDRYDCDVFIHTWDQYNHTTKTWHRFVDAPNDNCYKDEIEREIIRCYHPKAYVIEHQNVRDDGIIQTRYTQYGAFAIKTMMYAMSKANRLREQYQNEHGVKYDFCVVIRPDVRLVRKIDFGKVVNTYALGEDCVYAVGEDFDPTVKCECLRNVRHMDLMFFSTPEMISRFFSESETYFDRNYKSNQQPIFRAEYVMAKAIRDLGSDVAILPRETHRLVRVKLATDSWQAKLKRVLDMGVETHFKSLEMICRVRKSENRYDSTVMLEFFPFIPFQLIGFSFAVVGKGVRVIVGRIHEI